jgi:hypothetical protein
MVQMKSHVLSLCLSSPSRASSRRRVDLGQCKRETAPTSPHTEARRPSISAPGDVDRREIPSALRTASPPSARSVRAKRITCPGRRNILPIVIPRPYASSFRGRLGRGIGVALVPVRTFATFVREAIVREKRIKGCSRAKKRALIRSANPYWRELAPA